MRFSQNNDYYQISRITGPAHNILRLRLGAGAQSRLPVVQTFPSATANAPEILEPGKICAQVLEGVASANEALAHALQVHEIHYVADDTPSDTIYRDLAFTLIERIAQKGTFEALQSSAGPV